MRRVYVTIIAMFLSLTVTVAVAQQADSFSGKPFFSNISAMEYHGHNRNFDVECDSTGKVYVANFEGLIIWNGLEWETIHTPGISRITSLFKAPDGVIWFGGYNVIGTLDKDDTPVYLASDTSSVAFFGEIHDIFMENGALSFSAGDAYYRISDGRIEPYESASGGSLTSAVWRDIDVNQTLVIPELGMTALATASEGLLALDRDGNVMYTLDADDGLCSNSVNAMAYDGKGSLWGVTDNGIFQVSISTVFSHFGITDGLAGQVTSILRSGKTLYAGTLQGLYSLQDDGSFTKVSEIDLACWNLAIDRNGDVLAATAEGLFRCSRSGVSRLTDKHTLSICVGRDGSILTGEVDGIYYYGKDGSGTLMVSTPNVSKFKIDSEGVISAINYYRETYQMTPGSGRFEKVDNGNMSLLLDYTDSENRHWSSGVDGTGLICDELTSNQKEWCRPLGEYNIDAMFVDGNVAWIGGNFGLIRMNLEQMDSQQTFKPAIHMRSFDRDNSNVSFAASMDKIDPIGKPEYSYRLHNDDRQWSRWSPEPGMEFGHLSAGNYVLSVRCRDSFGNISETAPVEFRIKPPFYLRWHAFLLYALLISGISFAFLRYRLYKAAQDKLRLEKLVEQRTGQLKEAQNRLISQEREATVGKLTKGLIDRILNPMNYINNFSLLTKGLVNDLVQNLEDDKDKMTPDIYDDSLDAVGMMKANLEKIEQHGMATTRILKAMEALLKDYTGTLEDTDMEQLCRNSISVIGNYCRDSISEYGIELRMEVLSPGVTAKVNPTNMNRVFMSMLSNSVYAVSKKFQRLQNAGIKPCVTLTLGRKEDGHGCVIAIHDNGVGIEESIMDKIFDPFFTTKPTSEAPGVGLYLGQQIVQYSGGSIRVESSKDEYTTFTITLP